MNNVYTYGPLVLILIAAVILAWKAWDGRSREPSHLCEELELEYYLHVKFTDSTTLSISVNSPSHAQTMLNRFAFGGVDSAYLTENGHDVAFMNHNGVLIRSEKK